MPNNDEQPLSISPKASISPYRDIQFKISAGGNVIVLILLLCCCTTTCTTGSRSTCSVALSPLACSKILSFVKIPNQSIIVEVSGSDRREATPRNATIKLKIPCLHWLGTVRGALHQMPSNLHVLLAVLTTLQSLTPCIFPPPTPRCCCDMQYCRPTYPLHCR